METLSAGPDIPEDVQNCWFEVARAAQAACSGNNGFGLITLTVAVNQGKAVMWLPPVLDKIHPARVANVEMSAETMQMLGILLGNDGNNGSR